MNLAQCLIPGSDVVSRDLAGCEPRAPRGHVPEATRVRVHEAPDLSAYACQRVTEFHEKIIELVERATRPLSVAEISEEFRRSHSRKRIMMALCYLAKIGRITRREDGRRHRYGPPEVA